MSVNTKDFLRAAEQLLSNANHEIDYRNAISRAYYATFHAIAPLSAELPAALNYRTKGSHDEKISKLTRCSLNHPEAIRLKAVGIDIQKRKAQRVKADYDIDHTIAKTDAEEQLRKTEYLLGQIAKLKTALQIP